MVWINLYQHAVLVTFMECYTLSVFLFSLKKLNNTQACPSLLLLLLKKVLHLSITRIPHTGKKWRVSELFSYCIQFNFSQSYHQQSWQTAACLVLLSFFTDNLHHRCDLEIKYDVYVWHHGVWLWDTWEQMMSDVIDVQPAAWVPYLIWEPQWRWRLSMNNDLYFSVMNCSLKRILFARALFCAISVYFTSNSMMRNGFSSDG